MLKISLLGPFQLTLAGKQAERVQSRKSKALLAYLALESSRPLKLSELAAMFWPASSAPLAFQSLRLMLSRLKYLLEEISEDDFQPDEIILPLLLDSQTVQLNPRSVAWIDVSEFEALLSECGSHEHPRLSDCADCIERLAQAVSYARGELLEGMDMEGLPQFEDWLAARREHLRQLMLFALDQLSTASLRQAETAATREERRERLEAAAAYTRRALEIDPLRGSANLHWMKIMTVQGKVQKALDQYHLYQKSAPSQASPSQEIRSLYQQIRKHEYALPAVPPGRNGRPSRPCMALPALLNPLIGRGAQLTRLKQLLGSYRWVSVVGEGGVGKTSLAISAASESLDAFPDGVWFVPLAEPASRINPPAFEQSPDAISSLIRAIAQVMGFELPAEGLAAGPFYDQIKGKKLLLILDGFEQAALGTHFILDLLVSAPGVRVLVTTRQAFPSQAGCIMRLEGLPVPPDEMTLDADLYPSLELFIDCIRRHDRNFQFNERTLPMAARICRLAGGIPLALELAAPWTRQYPLEIIAGMIQFELDLQAPALSGQAEYSQALRIIFENTWTSLLPREQLVLALCASLTGEFSLDQAQAAAPATYHDIDALVVKNLIRKAGPNRYRIQETVRLLASRKLGETKAGKGPKKADKHAGMAHREHPSPRRPAHLP